MSPPEQRRARRYELRVSAEIRHGAATLLGTTRNLSTGGVLIALDRALPEGQELPLRLFVVEDDIETAEASGLELTGTVQWCAEADDGVGQMVGFQFVRVTERQAQALQRAIAALGPDA